MKAIKRNAVILTVALFVCAAVYLNWSYNRQVEDALQGGDKELSALGDGDSQENKDAEGGAQSLAEKETADTEGDAGLYYSVSGSGQADPAGAYEEYFAQVRLERSQARDEAAGTLQAVASAAGASQETVDNALKSMTVMAERTVKEAELENLIRAKGFIDCVVYLTDEGARVTVASPDGLTQAAVARITEVITAETDVTADKLTVIEIK